MAWGLLPTGFVRKNMSDIMASLIKYLKSPRPDGLGLDVNLNPDSFLYQLTGWFARPISEAWQLFQGISDAQNPDNATNAALDNIGAIRGVQRQGVSKAYGPVRCYGTDGLVILSGKQIARPLTGDIYNIRTAAAISRIIDTNLSAGPYLIGATQLDLFSTDEIGIDDRVILDEGGVNQETVTVTDVDTVLSVVTVTALTKPHFFGDTFRVYAAKTTAEAVEAGEMVVDGNQVTQIITPVGGWESVSNPTVDGDWNSGTGVEEDTAYKIRQENSLQVIGAGPYQAIRARIEDLDSVQSARVLNNVKLVIDADGLPGKSFAPVVYPSGLTAQQESEIFETIWRTRPAGIECYGGRQNILIAFTKTAPAIGGELYTVTIDGVDYTYMGVAGNDQEDVHNAIAALINTAIGYVVATPSFAYLSIESVLGEGGFSYSASTDDADVTLATSDDPLHRYGYVIDSKGYRQEVSFRYAQELQVYVRATITTDSDYPSGGDDMVKAAIKAEGDLLGLGNDIILLRLTCAAAEVAGVIGVQMQAKVGGAPGAWPADSGNISVSELEYPAFSVTRIEVA